MEDRLVRRWSKERGGPDSGTEPDEGRPSRPVMWDSLSSWVDSRSSFIWIVSSFLNNKSSQE